MEWLWSLTNNSGYFWHLIDTLMRQVRWFGPGQSLLFNGVTAVSSDRRFSLARPYSSYWNLVIKHVKVGDQGIYRCQVQYPVTLTREITLEVQGMEFFLLGQFYMWLKEWPPAMYLVNYNFKMSMLFVYSVILHLLSCYFFQCLHKFFPPLLPKTSRSKREVRSQSTVMPQGFHPPK